MVSEAFKRNVKKYGREINAKLVFDDYTFTGTDIVNIEKLFDTDFMMTTMQEVNGKLNGRYDLSNKSFKFLFGVKPELETTNQLDKDMSGLRVVGQGLVQTMVVEPNKVYNLRIDAQNMGVFPIKIAGFTLDPKERTLVEDTIYTVDGQTSYDLVISGKSIHFITFEPRFELDNRFVEHEYIDLGTFNVVEHERTVDAQGEDTTSFKAFDNMIKMHEIYNRSNLGITFPSSVKQLIEKIALYTGLDLVTKGVNLEKIISSDKWTGSENLTYRNILDDIAQATGTGITVFNNQLEMKEFGEAVEEVNENDMFSLKLKEEFGSVNVVSLKDTDSDTEYHYPANWQTIPKADKYEVVVEDNKMMSNDYAADLLTKLSSLKYYPFEADTQGFGYLKPLDVVNVVDMDGKVHKSVIMHSTLKIDSDVKESFKALPPVLHKDENELIRPEERKFNRTQSKVNNLTRTRAVTMNLDESLVDTVTRLELRIKKLEELMQ